MHVETERKLPPKELICFLKWKEDIDIYIHSGTLKIAPQEESIGLKRNLIHGLMKMRDSLDLKIKTIKQIQGVHWLKCSAKSIAHWTTTCCNTCHYMVRHGVDETSYVV